MNPESFKESLSLLMHDVVFFATVQGDPSKITFQEIQECFEA